MYWHSKPPKHYLGYVLEDRCPIIIIPGILLRWGFMKPLADFISMQGHPTYVLPNLGHNLSAISESAKKVQELIKENSLRDVVIVGHSKGGLIGKYLLSNLNSTNVRWMIAIATPFSGSALSKLIPHKSYKELHEESELIKELTIHRDINKKIISIIPEYDNHVWSEKGSFLENALDNIEVVVKGHHKVVNDNEVKKLVLVSIKRFFVD